MSETALRMENVFKRFRKGEIYDSLRDLLPAMTGRLFRRTELDATDEREFWALQDVSFEVKKGEAFAIIGHNGAGKSTILKHLNGIMKPTSGEVRVAGRLSALIEVGAGFHQDLTGRENVFLNGVILGMSRQEIRRKFDEIVEFAGMGPFIDTPVKRYSSGMHARLGFSVAAHLEPDILVIDEVLSVGDFAFQTKGVEKMRSVLNNGATVIFVSHNLRAVGDLCPRTLLMDHGRLIADGATPDIIVEYMNQMNAGRVGSEESDTVIESVIIRGSKGRTLSFTAGERMWVDVKIKARRRTTSLSCYLFLRDGAFYQIFNISSDRLGLGLFNLEAGEERNFSFELQLHLATGTFHLGIALHRRDNDQWLEVTDPVASISVTSPVDVGLAVNLYPSVEQTDAGSS